MIHGVWTIFRKELIDSLRDRKTLAFMLLIPTLAVPGLMAAVGRITMKLQQSQAVQVVRIAADERTQATYLKLAHEWFLGTSTAKGLKLAQAPLFQALLRPADLESLKSLPTGLLTDPQAFAEWCRSLTKRVRDGMDANVKLDEAAKGEISDEIRDELMDFYRVAIKGVGLVEFVTPDSLPPVPAELNRAGIPERLRDSPNIDKIAAAIRGKAVEAFLSIPTDYPGLLQSSEKTIEILLIRDSTIGPSDEAYSRVEGVISRVDQRVVNQRLASKHLSDAFDKPLKLRKRTDLASKSEVALELMGGMMPFLIVFFSFLGGMYPAIDLGSGEKERNTLETLVLTPVSRTEIALGKYLVILLTSLTSTLLGVVSLALSFRYILPEPILAQLDVRISPTVGALVMLLTIPPAMAFSGIFLAISIYARSFKEAQNYIAPLQFVIIFPAMAGILPGVEINSKLALIPIVNVTLLFKDFLGGEVNWWYYGLSFASCSALAAGCVVYAIRQFQDERVLFRT